LEKWRRICGLFIHFFVDDIYSLQQHAIMMRLVYSSSKTNRYVISMDSIAVEPFIRGFTYDKLNKRIIGIKYDIHGSIGPTQVVAISHDGKLSTLLTIPNFYPTVIQLDPNKRFLASVEAVFDIENSIYYVQLLSTVTGYPSILAIHIDVNSAVIKNQINVHNIALRNLVLL